MLHLNRFHLNGLRAVEAVARGGSLQRAADELGVSAGAVSQHVLRAEKQLGRPLFQRTARGLQPLPSAAALLARLGEAFGRLDSALEAASRPGDTLTISVAPVFASKWLVSRLAGFRKLQPDLRVRIDATTELVDLDASDIDLAIRVGRGGWPGVKLEKLLDQSVYPVCAPSVAQQLKNPRALCTAPILRDVNSNVPWRLWLDLHGMSEADLAPGDGFTDAALCLDATIAGQGVMLAWQTLAADAIAAGLLVAPFEGRAETGNSYWLVTSQTRSETPAVAAFRRWLVAEVALIDRVTRPE